MYKRKINMKLCVGFSTILVNNIMMQIVIIYVSITGCLHQEIHINQ